MRQLKSILAGTLAAAALLVGTPGAFAQDAAPAWLPIVASGPTNLPPVQNEVQRVAVDAEGGSYTLTFNGATTAIPFAAGATLVRNQLNGLATIGGVGGEVTVTGGPGDKGATNPYLISFGGSLADQNVAQLIADSTELTGGFNSTAAVSTVVGGGPGTAQIAIFAQNIGGLPSSGTVTLTFTLPEGVVTTATPFSSPFSLSDPDWTCGLDGTGGAGQSAGKCTSNFVVDPGFAAYPVRVPVRAEPGAQSGIVEATYSGGGAVGEASYEMPLVISAIEAPPGLQSFNAGAYDPSGQIDNRAGGHPYSASAGIMVNTRRSPRTGQIVPAGEFRDILVDTPPGFFGNPLSAPTCAEALAQEECEPESIVATAQVWLQSYTNLEAQELSSVNNIEAPFGYPAKFRFRTGSNEVTVNVVASLRSDEDYGLRTGSFDTPQIKPVYGTFFNIWGTPFDEGHDGQRCRGWNNLRIPFAGDCITREELIEKGLEEVAFLSSPVDCAEEALRPPVATINVNTWQHPQLWFADVVPIEPVTGCDELDFEAGFAFEPTSAKAADSPASFRTEVTTPTGGLLSPDPDARINPTIRTSVVDLPEGVVLNASAADGLGACSFSQIGYLGNDRPRPNEIRFSKAPHTCPDASKIGSGELKSELIAETLRADLFLAEQGAGNPFGSLFAIYLVIEDPRNGIFIKLPGEVQVNQQTGRQKVTFTDLPPLPFTWLKLNLKGGPRSPLATPTTCGVFSPSATNTPWSAPESGPPHVSGGSFAIDQGPGGAPCANTPAQRPFAIGLSAGAANPIAGAHSPFSIRITRPDGHQELDRLEISQPLGFVASLRGVPYCSEAQIAAAAARSGRAEQANAACPAASQIGTTNSAAGSGPNPYYAAGKLYLAGPYKGQPLSVVAITPAVAGPFDLGNVVVRSAVRVDPESARITALTDPLPRILQGVPLRIRDIRINLDRDGWAQNPTSCEAKSTDLVAHGSNGAISSPVNGFQVGNCAALAFKPRVNLQLFGGTARAKYQGVRAVVRPRPGDSNIAGTTVKFPTSAFVAQEHLQNICTRVQWAAEACPKNSVYGNAIAYTPLLDEPLRGTVHLRSSSNLLPDLVADLRGPAHQPIKVEVAIKTDAVKGALRSTVMSAPDAPVSFFRLQTFGGKKGLIVNSRNICRGSNAARVTMRAHNGRRVVQNVPARNARCAKQRKRAKAKAAQKRKRMIAQRRAAARGARG